MKAKESEPSLLPRRPGGSERVGRGEAQYERVGRILRGRILRGELRPGQRLVRRTVAAELGVSAIPVVEALHRLEFEGLVEHEPNVGARVRPLTLEQIEDDIALREAIESQVARMLAGRLGPVVLEELRARAGRLDALMQQETAAGAAPGRDEQGMAEHAAFHLELARLTGRPVLLAEDRKVWSRRYTQLAWIDAAVQRTVPADWHQRLIDALATGDPLVADEAFRYHIRRSPAEYRAVLREMASALEALQTQE